MGKKTLHHFTDEYITALAARGFSPRTLAVRRFMLGRFLDYLAELTITDIGTVTRSVIEDYQTEIYRSVNRQGLPNGVDYQNKMLGAVKGFMRHLKERDHIVADPAAEVVYAKAPKRLPRSVLTTTEARRIVSAPDTSDLLGYRDRTILELFYSTGIRKEEINKLTLTDVDYQDGFLRINNGKGGKDRVVPLGRIACRYLENYIKSVRPEFIRDPYNHHLFLSSRGNRLSKNVAWELVKKYAKQAKLKKNVSPHTFRHTCATAMLKNRADIRAIQELLGHASLESTQVYTHITINDLKETHSRCHPRERDKE